jgi:hypothetical protein
MKEKLRDELHKFLLVSAYLYVCLLALLLFKAAVLRDTGVHAFSIGFAAGKALLLAKFVLIGEAIRLGARRNARSLLHLILSRSVMFLLLLVALSVVEEILVGLIFGHDIAHTLADLVSRGIPELLANCLLMLLVLVPLMTIIEVSNVVGKGSVRRFLLGPPRVADD